MRSRPSTLTLLFLCLLTSLHASAGVTRAWSRSARAGQRSDLYLWLSAEGQTVLALRSDADIPDKAALRRALEAAVGGPIMPVSPDDPRFHVPEGDWALVADLRRALHRRGALLEGQVDAAPLLPLLRRQGVDWMTVDVMQQTVPSSTLRGARVVSPGRRRYVYGFRAFRTDRPAGRPVRFSYGYSRRDVLRLLIPMAVVLLLPVGLTLWMRARALRTEASVDPAVVWFGYGRFLQWLALSPWLVWVPTLITLHASDFVGFLIGPTWLAHTGLRYAVWYLPSPVIVWCYALSHPVFARVRGLDYTVRDLVRQAAWGQARILAVLCLLTGGTELSENPRLGVAWLGAALFTWIVAGRGATRALGTAPRALTVGALRDRVFALAAQAGVRVQQVYVMPAGKGRMANAFAAVGNNVILTDFLLERLSRREVDAVVAHELTHLRRRHPALLTLLQLPLWIGAGVIAAMVEARTAAPGLGAGAYVAVILTGLLLTYFISRRFEYTADAGALALTDDPRACITGLAKLARLNQMPLEWGRHHARWLTHPTTQRRVETVARRGGLPEQELRTLVAGQESDTGDDHYALPPGLNDAAVWTTMEKGAYRQRVAWLAIGVTTLTPALVLVAARSARLIGPVAWAADGLGLAVTLLLHRALIDRAQGRWFATLERRLRARHSPDVAGHGDGETFVTLAPAGAPRLYEGFFDWDIGLLSLDGDRLSYAGEQTRFSLAAGQILAVEARADTPGWRPWSRVYVTWRGTDGEDGDGHTFSLRPRPDGTWRQVRDAADALARRLRTWQTASAAGHDTQDAAPPPTEASVTSMLPRAVASPRALVSSLLFQAAIALGVSVLCGLNFDSEVNSGGGAWYVLLVAEVMTVLSFLPYWRRPRRAE